jgi:hypothetical protein
MGHAPSIAHRPAQSQMLLGRPLLPMHLLLRRAHLPQQDELRKMLGIENAHETVFGIHRQDAGAGGGELSPDFSSNLPNEGG